MNIKKSHLKEVIKQIVRESLQQREFETLIKEVSPPGKKSERMIQHIKKSLRKTHPEWDEDKVTSVAIATAWKHHNKDNVDEAGLTSEDDSSENSEMSLDDIIDKVIQRTKDPEKAKYLASQLYLHKYGTPADMDAIDAAINNRLGGDVKVNSTEENVDESETEEHHYDEKEEIDLIKSIKQIVNKLMDMHKGMNSGKKEVEEASYKQVSPNETDSSKENKALKIQTEPKVTENHKVQHQSFKTINDLDNDPKNVRDSEIPQA